MIKEPADIIILNKCTINNNHMMYGPWNMKSDGQNVLSFSTVFLPVIQRTTQKIKIWKNWKKHVEISSLYTRVLKIMIIRYTVPWMWYVMDVIVIFHFGRFFHLSLPNNLRNQNLRKLKKTPGYIIILQ